MNDNPTASGPDPCDDAGAALGAQQLHREAMELAEEAFSLRHKLQERAEALLRNALAREVLAAFCLAGRADLEPSRSILYRSAAALAMEVKERDLAAELAWRGLEGKPPPEIRQELSDILCRAQAQQ